MAPKNPRTEEIANSWDIWTRATVSANSTGNWMSFRRAQHQTIRWRLSILPVGTLPVPSNRVLQKGGGIPTKMQVKQGWHPGLPKNDVFACYVILFTHLISFNYHDLPPFHGLVVAFYCLNLTFQWSAEAATIAHPRAHGGGASCSNKLTNWAELKMAVPHW